MRPFILETHMDLSPLKYMGSPLCPLVITALICNDEDSWHMPTISIMKAIVTISQPKTTDNPLGQMEIDVTDYVNRVEWAERREEIYKSWSAGKEAWMSGDAG